MSHKFSSTITRSEGMPRGRMGDYIALTIFDPVHETEEEARTAVEKIFDGVPSFKQKLRSALDKGYEMKKDASLNHVLRKVQLLANIRGAPYPMITYLCAALLWIDARPDRADDEITQ